MDDPRLRVWESLFRRALTLLGAVGHMPAPPQPWSFGGGTVLMRRHRHPPYVIERIMGRDVNVETTSEVIAKKVWHRGDHFTARDMFDLAMVADRDPQALHPIGPILAGQREVILRRMETLDARLREDFIALEPLEFTRSFDDCAALIREALS